MSSLRICKSHLQTFNPSVTTLCMCVMWVVVSVDDIDAVKSTCESVTWGSVKNSIFNTGNMFQNGIELKKLSLRWFLAFDGKKYSRSGDILNRDHIHVRIFRNLLCFVGWYSILDMWFVEMVEMVTNHTTALKYICCSVNCTRVGHPIWIVKDGTM